MELFNVNYKINIYTGLADCAIQIMRRTKAVVTLCSDSV